MGEKRTGECADDDQQKKHIVEKGAKVEAREELLPLTKQASHIQEDIAFCEVIIGEAAAVGGDDKEAAAIDVSDIQIVSILVNGEKQKCIAQGGPVPIEDHIPRDKCDKSYIEQKAINRHLNKICSNIKTQIRSVSTAWRNFFIKSDCFSIRLLQMTLNPNATSVRGNLSIITICSWTQGNFSPRI